jgi:hypothetical protein
MTQPLPSETMFVLMLVHLKAKVDELEDKIPEKTSVKSEP